MKYRLQHIIFVAFVALLSSLKAYAWGESTSYVLVHTDEETLNTISTGESMALSGPGATLTFEAKRQTLAVNYFFVEQSTDGGSNWTVLANPSLGTSYSTYTYSISTDVTHIRFRTKTGATLTKYYKNVYVTRATTFATSTTSLDFGTVTNRNSATLNALIDYNNTTYNQQVTGSCTDPNFTVTATTVGETGSSQAVPVVFTPTSAGTHTGTVTLTMNGKTVSFQVTGVGRTTYYTRATASATTGGSAYVSFTSFDEATNSNATTNSGVTTEQNASATAYFHAVPNKRYAFAGWKSSLTDNTYVSTEADFQTTYTYTSENSSSPTQVTYYAVFEEKPNVIILEPTSSEYDLDTYESVTLHRTFLKGYNTIALPFDTDVPTLTGRSSSDDWVAQLSSVTYNQHDGYTLFFTKVTSNVIHAFQPYVLYLGEQLVNPSWNNIELTSVQSVSITPNTGYGSAASPDGNTSYSDWQMTSNFTAAFDMNGLLGIVNSAGALQLGGNGSSLNAFTAYITPAPGAAGVKMRSAFIDDFGNTTYIDGLPEVVNKEENVYDLSGRRIKKTHSLSKGIYINGGRKYYKR